MVACNLWHATPRKTSLFPPAVPPVIARRPSADAAIQSNENRKSEIGNRKPETVLTQSRGDAEKYNWGSGCT